MASYTFGTLSPTEFENLVRDLVSADRQVVIGTYKEGRDTGIDFRYVDKLGQLHIGQAKHYANSTVSALKNKLRLEIPNVQKHNPHEYVVATSLGLAPADEDEIKQIFQPVVGNVLVLGREALNALIDSSGKEVERRHFKLWLTSTNILEKVLKSRILSLTNFTLEAVRRKLSRYVQNQSFSEALRILNEHHVCVISGDPGIGKTTLAQVLLAYYVDEGFTPIKITSSITEAAEMDQAETKRVFYYDDFLGASIVKPTARKK